MPDEDKENNADTNVNENANKDLQPEKAVAVDNNSESSPNNQQNSQNKTEEKKVEIATNSNDDELERLKKENERLKEIQRLKEENEKLKGSSSNSSQKGENNSNKSFVPYIVIGLAVIVVVLLVLVFGFHIFSSSVSSLTPSVNANASGSFFLGPDGESLGSTYINGLSDLSSQLASVGAQQVAGSFIYENVSDGSNGPSPGYYVLVYGNSNNYDIVPISVPSNFSNYSISQNGKPTFVYLGAQGCPFCAGMRWSIAIALSRFGNFSKLFYDRSATNDANVPTLMFNFSSTLFKEATSQPSLNGAPYGDSNPEPFVTGAYYTSKYINFEPLDEMGGSFLVNTTGIEQISPIIYSNVYVLGMHDFNSTSSAILSAAGFGIQNFFVGGVPFFDINNKYVFDGAIIDAGTYLTSSGLNSAYSTHQDVLNSIENPTSGSMGETELGAANILTAQICSVINNTAPVCSLSYISELESKINALSYSSEYCLSGSCKIVS